MSARPLPLGAVEVGEEEDPVAPGREHPLSLDCWCGPALIVHRGLTFVCHRRADGRLPTAADLDAVPGLWEDHDA